MIATENKQWETTTKLFSMVLAIHDMPFDLTPRERLLQVVSGALPARWTPIHIVSPEFGGDDSLDNLAIIPTKNIEEYDRAMNHIHLAGNFTRQDIPYLQRNVSRSYGGITVCDIC